MRRAAATLGVAAATTVVIGLLDGQGWASYLIGAVLALALWVMLFFGSFGSDPPYDVPPLVYAAASVIGVVLGAVVVAVGDNTAFWGVGFIIAGVVWPAYGLARRDSGRA